MSDRARTERPGSRGRGGLARSTAIFSIATAISRVVGLVREVIAAAFFGTTASYSAFNIASQIPNLMSNLFAQAALSAAFVPVFTDLLQQGKRREAFRLASTLFWLILIALGAITAVLILAAGIVMPAFTGGFSASTTTLTVGLTRVLFPVVLLLGLTGMLVGILQSFDEFTIPAIAPAVWNVVIVVGLVALRPSFHGGQQLYAYAIAWLAATVVQMLMVASALRRIDFRLELAIDWRDPRVKQVLVLMLPVSIGLGIINLDQLLNSAVGTLIKGGHAPAAINQAFRLYLLPQGMFSVAVTTVLFPSLSRMASARDPANLRRTIGTGMRQINLFLVPSAALMIVLATPIVRLVYQRGSFGPGSTHLVSVALFWFAFSLPFAGINLLLTRTFFAVQRPWIPTRLAGLNMIVDLVVSLVLYKPLGIAGLVIGTAVANAVMTALQLQYLTTGLNGDLEGPHTTMITIRIVIASAIMAAASWVVWRLLDDLLGTSLVAQLISVGAALAAAGYVYMRLVLLMRIPEARQVEGLVLRRLGRARG